MTTIRFNCQLLCLDCHLGSSWSHHGFGACFWWTVSIRLTDSSPWFTDLSSLSFSSLTHGHQTAKKKVSSSAIYFESFPYQVDNVSYKYISICEFMGWTLIVSIFDLTFSVLWLRRLQQTWGQRWAFPPQVDHMWCQCLPSWLGLRKIACCEYWQIYLLSKWFSFLSLVCTQWWHQIRFGIWWRLH
jgi:hypothetical protein